VSGRRGKASEAQREALEFGARYGWICLTDFADGTQRVVVQRGWFVPTEWRASRPGRFADITPAGRAALEAAKEPK
jgi:hypothetical protein